MGCQSKTWCVPWSITKTCTVNVMVLNLIIGLVSPQFHIIFDNFFETTWLNRIEALLLSAWQHLAGFDFKARFIKSEKLKVAKQQLVLLKQPVPTAQGGNSVEFINTTDVVHSPANEADDLSLKPVAIPLEGEDVPQFHSQPDAPSPITYSSMGQLRKISQ